MQFSSTAVYGRGTYFARDAQYSLDTRYSPPDEHGVKTLLLCRVLAGDFTKGNGAMDRPPTKPNSSRLYESLVNNTDEPSIFVLSSGSDTQCYPEFLLEVKRIPRSTGP